MSKTDRAPVMSLIKSYRTSLLNPTGVQDSPSLVHNYYLENVRSASRLYYVLRRAPPARPGAWHEGGRMLRRLRFATHASGSATACALVGSF